MSTRLRRQRRTRSCSYGLGLAFAWLVAAPWAANGQVFLASRAHPDFTIGPLFVVASVTDKVTVGTPIRISWNVVTPRGRTLDVGDDRYLHVGWGRGQTAQTSGVVLSRDILDRITPGATTYHDVVRLCGPRGEHHESLTAPDHRSLVYRGRRVVPHRRRTFGWIATVSHWDIENHEVVIEFEQEHVRDVQARIRRVRGAPETA